MTVKEAHEEMVTACARYKEAPTKAHCRAWKMATDKWNTAKSDARSMATYYKTGYLG